MKYLWILASLCWLGASVSSYWQSGISTDTLLLILLMVTTTVAAKVEDLAERAK